ncbi:putative Uncharacterized oxidoreductase C24B10.20 [Glarea lozoyensis 74030]|uniref:Putative Uncharacterized oxidoreductase C24B10.20 n=1 Tax=Glarea lozoyensis (strain ATCC 74030 / MF5533) TaxID=1104152 RepID=H0EQT8_GLAL7|nr:putative Uncharacterized oxidoreductase C24B10.20 [Glarea lozoyensis 74030]
MTSYLITGCSRGLGLSMVETLASMPKSEVGTIFATSRSESAALKDLASKHNDRVVTVLLDVLSLDSINAAVTTVEGKLNGKGLDVLINNAGIMGTAPGGAPAMKDLESHFEMNVLAPHRITVAFLPLLKAGNLKKIANISPAYKVTKAALNMLTAQYAIDLESEGFTVFCVSPGVSYPTTVFKQMAQN